MVHQDRWYNGVKMVSATELPTIIAKPFLATWKLKLCHCQTHKDCPKKLKETEKAVIAEFGLGHCGDVYANKVKDDAGELGTEVHAIIEAWFKHTAINPSEFSRDAVMWADKIIDKLKEQNAKPALILPEDTILDYESNLAGSPDAVLEYNGELVIADYKIKNSLDPLTGMQGSAYRYLLKRRFDTDISKMLVLWCKKETVSKIVEPVMIDLNDWFDPWVSLVKLWNTLNPKRLVKIL